MQAHDYTPRRRPTVRERAQWFAEHGTNVPQQIRERYGYYDALPLARTVLFAGSLAGIAGVMAAGFVGILAIGAALKVGDAFVEAWMGVDP